MESNPPLVKRSAIIMIIDYYSEIIDNYSDIIDNYFEIIDNYSKLFELISDFPELLIVILILMIIGPLHNCNYSK